MCLSNIYINNDSASNRLILYRFFGAALKRIRLGVKPINPLIAGPKKKKNLPITSSAVSGYKKQDNASDRETEPYKGHPGSV